MTVTVSATEDDALTALNVFVMGILPAGWVTTVGQHNRVPTPSGSYVQMTPLSRERLSTNRKAPVVFTSADGVTTSTQQILQPVRLTIQIDARGEGAADVIQTISTLFRDEYGVSVFRATGVPLVPLYTSSPRQLPLTTAENQYQDRWGLDADMQLNSILTITQETADELSVGLIEMDEKYPPVGVS